MLNCRSRSGLVLGGMLLAWSCVAFAQAGPGVEVQEPREVIQSISDRLRQVLREDRERLRTDRDYVFQLADEILLPHVDFNRVSGLVLGRYWRDATPEQRKRFSEEFRKMLVRTYATAFHELDDWEIRFKPTRETPNNPKDVIVATEVVPAQSEPWSVVYRMHLRDGRWKAYDVKIEGVSLVTNYRSSFARQVRSGGMDKLIDRLAALNQRRSDSGSSPQGADGAGTGKASASAI